MKTTTILLLAVALTSCGKLQEGINLDNPNLIPVELLNDPYEAALSSFLEAELDLSDVVVFKSNRASMTEVCGNDAPACADGEARVIVTTTPIYNCILMLHEFAHIALFDIHGDVDAGHSHDIFDNANLSQLCEEFI